jgi:hypothetical protein
MLCFWRGDNFRLQLLDCSLELIFAIVIAIAIYLIFKIYEKNTFAFDTTDSHFFWL